MAKKTYRGSKLDLTFDLDTCIHAAECVRVLPKVFDTVMDLGGDFEVTQFEIGKNKSDPSYAKILVKGNDRDHLDRILGELLKTGATIPEIEDLQLEEAQKDKALPEGFYTTTNHPTYIPKGGCSPP